LADDGGLAATPPPGGPNLQLSVELADVLHPDRLPVEVVERKGRGHPDTLCDAIAEAASLALSRAYLERFGRILHHNVDKVLLAAGRASPRFGGGSVQEPAGIYIAGRGTEAVEGERVPVAEITVEACRACLGERLHAFDPARHARIECLVRPGSQELAELFARGQEPLANDTACGVGFAPASLLERVVLAVEQALTAPESVALRPQVGEDVKVLGIRRGDAIELTVSCATVDRYLGGLPAYEETMEWVRAQASQVARSVSGREVEVTVNAADDRAAGSVYLTVTGTSAEAGDDGQAGRGNRVGGLITPYRFMNIESVAGKNPVTHVGKLYSVAARQVAEALVARVPAVESASCLLASRIGQPVARPRLADIRLGLADGEDAAAHRAAVEEVVEGELQGIPSLWRRLLERQILLF
jgi:S-adenosylmethionine synthetase